MSNPSKINYSHGDTGTQPNDGYDAVSGSAADPEYYDWYINTYLNKINATIDRIQAIDSDGDGNVDRADAADTADQIKGNDIDSDGDGKVDSAESADDATTLQSNTPSDLIVEVEDHGSTLVADTTTLNFDGDLSVTDNGGGTVTVDVTKTNDTHAGVDDDGSPVANDPDRLNFGTDLNATVSSGVVTIDHSGDADTYKGNDIDPDGDGLVEEIDTTAIEDGGSKEIDVTDFAGDGGTSGQVPTTDGSSVSWGDILEVKNDGSSVETNPDDIDFGPYLRCTDDGDGTVTADGKSAALLNTGYIPDYI